MILKKITNQIKPLSHFIWLVILVFIVIAILLALVVTGIWFTFGPGGKGVRDPIADHARMHELGIAHKHD